MKIVSDGLFLLQLSLFRRFCTSNHWSLGRIRMPSTSTLRPIWGPQTDIASSRAQHSSTASNSRSLPLPTPSVSQLCLNKAEIEGKDDLPTILESSSLLRAFRTCHSLESLAEWSQPLEYVQTSKMIFMFLCCVCWSAVTSDLKCLVVWSMQL